MNSSKITNILLLIIAIPIVVFVLKTLKFIFVPLILAMFITLLFVPLMRRMKRKGIHKLLRVFTSLSIIVAGGILLFQVLSLSGQEIVSTKDVFFEKAASKLSEVEVLVKDNIGIDLFPADSDNKEMKRDMVIKYAQTFSNFLVGAIPSLLTTLFFIVLLLFETFDFERLMHSTILRQRFTSIKAFARIEKDLVKFLFVKFLISAGTGIGTGFVCYTFGVSFPIFWGIFAFAINFVQMVGSFIAII
ncbi:MAG: AI-2E family transporter, partial [Crocinitomicaceae bacterium]